MESRQFCKTYFGEKPLVRNSDCLPAETYFSVSDNNRVRLRIDGMLTTTAFQRARLLIEKLYYCLPFKFAPPQIRGMLQVDWHEHLQKLRLRIGGKLWLLERDVAVFVNDEFIGSDADLYRYINQTFIFNLPVDLGYYESLVTESLKDYITKSKRTFVYFTLSVDDSVIGSLVFMLYTELMPVTCEYFLNLCNTTNGNFGDMEEPYYKNTLVHRIVKNGWIQCGKSQLNDGNASTTSIASLYDESYCIPHNRLGVLSLTNDGKHCNRPQFFVCLKANPWMNYYYVAFGQLVEGIKVLRTLENLQTCYEAPVKRVIITDCGEYNFNEEPKFKTPASVSFDHHIQPDAEGECTCSKSCDHLWFDDTDLCFFDNDIDEIHKRGGIICPSKMPQVCSRQFHPKCKSNMRSLLMEYCPRTRRAEERRDFIYKMFRLILSCILHSNNKEFCLHEMSLCITRDIQKIYRVARQTALQIIAEITKQGYTLEEIGKHFNGLLKENNVEPKDIVCPAGVEKILKNGITNLFNSVTID